MSRRHRDVDDRGARWCAGHWELHDVAEFPPRYDRVATSCRDWIAKCDAMGISRSAPHGVQLVGFRDGVAALLEQRHPELFAELADVWLDQERRRLRRERRTE